MIYGDIFNPSTLSKEFFWNFESSTALLDDQNIINYFKKTNRGLYKLQQTVEDAQRILQKVFGDWINSIAIEIKDSGYRFDGSCFFINFNYTYTLEKWHISFHSDNDKKQIENVMQKIGCDN